MNCKKCGGWAFPHYEAKSDLLRYRCGCGYTWTTPPLDAKEKNSSVPYITPQELQDFVVDIQGRMRDRMRPFYRC